MKSGILLRKLFIPQCCSIYKIKRAKTIRRKHITQERDVGGCREGRKEKMRELIPHKKIDDMENTFIVI